MIGEAIVVFLLALVAGSIVGAPVALAVRSCSVRFTLLTLIGELAFATTVLVWLRWVRSTPLSAIGLPRAVGADVLAGVVTGIALIGIGMFVELVSNVAGRLILGHPPPQPEQVQPCVHGAALAFLAPVVILAAPFGEELLFRGLFFRELRGRLSLWPAAVVSSFAFAAVHFAGPEFLLLLPALFCVGMGLAFVYERRRSLLASMAAHATFNVVGFLFIAIARR